jgi:hypothetical protein
VQAGDCYAFGVVLWELVTGELPVRAKMRCVVCTCVVARRPFMMCSMCCLPHAQEGFQQSCTSVRTGQLLTSPVCRGVNVRSECCEAAVALIEACLSQHISARPTAAQLVTALEALQDSSDVRTPTAAAAANAA